MEPITGLFSINAAFPHLRVQPNEHRTKVRLNFLFSPILILQPNEHRTQRTKVRFNFFCTDSKLYALSVGDLVGLLQKVNQSGPSESLPWLIPELYGPCIDSDHNKCCDRNQCIHLFLLGAAAFFCSAELVDSGGLIHSGAWPIIFWEFVCGIVVGDTQSDSIQCLNFAKKWFIQYSIQYCFTQDSIQNIIQLKKRSAD